MCTAATYRTKDAYLGRTLDNEFSYGEKVTVTPRNYVFKFTEMGEMKTHFAMIGMAHIAGDYPLYYDGVNEKGLAMAGLNFPGNAHFEKSREGFDNVAQFELLPWLLSQAASVEDAKKLIEKLNITDTPFAGQMPAAPLHWIIYDGKECIVMEAMKDGIHIHDNKAGVMANNPPFEMHMMNLNNYMNLTAKPPVNRFGGEAELKEYCKGIGAVGLPGDLSSMSRFVRVAFVRANSVSKSDEKSSVSQFFHIMNSVDQQRGCDELAGGEYEITIYTSCMNVNKGVYYYTTYDNHRINAVDMHGENLDSDKLIGYPIILDEDINFVNKR